MKVPKWRQSSRSYGSATAMRSLAALSTYESETHCRCDNCQGWCQCYDPRSYKETNCTEHTCTHVGAVGKRPLGLNSYCLSQNFPFWKSPAFSAWASPLNLVFCQPAGSEVKPVPAAKTRPPKTKLGSAAELARLRKICFQTSTLPKGQSNVHSQTPSRAFHQDKVIFFSLSAFIKMTKQFCVVLELALQTGISQSPSQLSKS